MGQFSIHLRFGAGLIVTAITATYLHFKIKKLPSTKMKPIDKMIKRGTRPSCEIHTKQEIDRLPTIVEIIDKFILQKVEPPDTYGVIFGPSGVGKTYLTRSACYEYSEGVLYCEASSTAKFPHLLAKTIGMATEPTGFFDLIMNPFGYKFYKHYEIPADDVAAVGFMLDILNQRAAKFEKKHGRKPCLFIDGADMIAKHQPDVFSKLVDVAKQHGSNWSLNVIFVSSKGNIISQLVDTLSPAGKLEILDISDQEAIKFLSCDMSERLARSVVQLVGGRFKHLINAAWVIQNSKATWKSKKEGPKILSEVEQLQRIKDFLHHKYIQGWVKYSSCDSCGDAARIVSHIAKDGPITVDALHGSWGIDNAIPELYERDILRYDIDGNICFDSKLIENYMNDRYNST